MRFSALLACLMLCAGSVHAAAPVLVSLGRPAAPPASVVQKPVATPPVMATGVPKGWERLRGHGPGTDICAAIRRHGVEGTEGLPLDAARILRQALRQQDCLDS